MDIIVYMTSGLRIYLENVFAIYHLEHIGITYIDHLNEEGDTVSDKFKAEEVERISIKYG